MKSLFWLWISGMTACWEAVAPRSDARRCPTTACAPPTGLLGGRGGAHPVGQRDVERLCAAAAAQQATGAIFVTTGRFTPRARLAGEQRPDLQLIDSQLLRRMLGTEVMATLREQYPPPAAADDDAVAGPGLAADTGSGAGIGAAAPAPATAGERPAPHGYCGLSPVAALPLLLLLALGILIWLTSH